jgi:hypothetical protein
VNFKSITQHPSSKTVKKSEHAYRNKNITFLGVDFLLFFFPGVPTEVLPLAGELYTNLKQIFNKTTLVKYIYKKKLLQRLKKVLQRFANATVCHQIKYDVTSICVQKVHKLFFMGEKSPNRTMF